VGAFNKILLVEDNVELRSLYETFLESNGYQIASAGDGEEGLQAAKQNKPDLIFLDVMMPKKDGFQVLKELRSDPSYGCQNTKIIILTNLGDPDEASPEVKKTMDGYMVKAEITLNTLVETIKKMESAAPSKS
jgi:CheY-like chemotaxis protein